LVEILFTLCLPTLYAFKMMSSWLALVIILLRSHRPWSTWKLLRNLHMDYMSIALLNLAIIKQFIHACYGDLKKISERGYIFMTVNKLFNLHFSLFKIFI
jgi:hypothetical protein